MHAGASAVVVVPGRRCSSILPTSTARAASRVQVGRGGLRSRMIARLGRSVDAVILNDAVHFAGTMLIVSAAFALPCAENAALMRAVARLHQNFTRSVGPVGSLAP